MYMAACPPPMADFIREVPDEVANPAILELPRVEPDYEMMDDTAEWATTHAEELRALDAARPWCRFFGNLHGAVERHV